MSWGVRGFQYLGYTCHRHRFLHTSWLFTACSITLCDPHSHEDLVHKWLSQCLHFPGLSLILSIHTNPRASSGHPAQHRGLASTVWLVWCVTWDEGHQMSKLSGASLALTLRWHI